MNRILLLQLRLRAVRDILRPNAQIDERVFACGGHDGCGGEYLVVHAGFDDPFDVGGDWGGIVGFIAEKS